MAFRPETGPLIPPPPEPSDGKVWFSLVNCYFWPNPKPELGFGSALSPNLNLNRQFGFG
jgi:hypothetical protein